MVDAVLLIAPIKGSEVQVRYIPECSSGQEVFLHKANQPLYFSFCKRMSGLTQLGAESNGFHECLIVLLPHRLAFIISLQYNTFHIVCEDILRDPHIAKCPDHSNKQVLLLGIGEKLHIALAAVMADHCKAGGIVLGTIVIQNFCKAPVHLVCFPGFCGIPPAAIALWGNQLPLCGN